MQLIRTRPIQSNSRKISIEKEKQVIRDVKIRKLPVDFVAEKHSLKPNHIKAMLRHWKVKGNPVMTSNEDAKPQEEPPTQVIVVAQKDIEFLSFLMAEYQVYFYIPEYYKLTEKIGSKMNKDELIITATS